MISYSLLNFVRNFMILLLLLTGLGSFSLLPAQSGEIPYTIIELNNLDQFKSPSQNWVISGGVKMDSLKRHDVQLESGIGVLVNTSEGESPKDIYTIWEHGDLDLELEFMMAKESNSGIYLQGRYEIQMLDSWGVENPSFSDMGGVFESWEDGRGFGGVPPRVNAAREPGVWQHMKIRFLAPRFDENEEKIAHANLIEVILNGVVIHRDVDLTHPTRGAVSTEEVEKAALRFQGDHGPVAFRNIRIKNYN